MFQLSHISIHVIIFFLLFLTNSSIIVFNIFFFNIYTSPTFRPHLPFHLPTTSPTFLPYLFISPLPSKLISFFLFLFIFLYFCLFLFTPSSYKFVVISSILCIVFPHNKKVVSLSLSNFWWIFFFLHICFSLIIFYIL